MVFQQVITFLFVSCFYAVVVTVMSSATYKIEQLPNSTANLGEGGYWDSSSQNFFMVDLVEGQLKRYDYRLNKFFKCQIENETRASFIIPIEGRHHEFAVGILRRVALVKWDGVSRTCNIKGTIVAVEQSYSKYEYNRFNDAKCDPAGRLFAGTMHRTDFEKRTGHLYKITGVNKSEMLLSNLGISNGLTWDLKKEKFYYIDSLDHNLKAFDYDVRDGSIKNPKVIFELKANGLEKILDGMTIDSNGHLYIAIKGGSAILKIDPSNGKHLQTIEMPWKKVSSVAFGGPNLDILFVTSVNDTSKPGPTFKITGLGVKGLPSSKLRLRQFSKQPSTVAL